MKDIINVSIIMPVYNSEKYLEECVNSILKQKFESFELLLIDDGSTDKSSEICDKLASQDKRIRVFHKNNSGISDTRNFGIKHARGTYIAFSDHDDAVKNGFLEDNYSYAVETGADVVKFGRDSIIINDNRTIKRNKRQFDKRCLNSESIKDEFLELCFNDAMVCVWDGIFKKDFLLKNNIIFDTKYKKGGEDIEFCRKCFVKASKIAFNDGIYYEHYIRIGYSTSTKQDDMRLMKFKMLTNNLIDSINDLQIQIENNPWFFLCIIKELVYPSMIYFSHIKESYYNVKNYLKSECGIYRKYSPNFLKLVKINLKWGIYASLFKFGMYRIMYKLIWFKEMRLHK